MTVLRRERVHVALRTSQVGVFRDIPLCERPKTVRPLLDDDILGATVISLGNRYGTGGVEVRTGCISSCAPMNLQKCLSLRRCTTCS